MHVNALTVSNNLNHIRFQTMVLVFKAINRTAPVYLQTLVSPHGPERALHSSTSAGRLVPSLRANKGRSAKSQLFSVFTMNNVRTAELLSIFHKRFKTHLFRLHLDPAEHDSLLTPPPKKKKNQAKNTCMHLYVFTFSTLITEHMYLKCPR